MSQDDRFLERGRGPEQRRLGELLCIAVMALVPSACTEPDDSGAAADIEAAADETDRDGLTASAAHPRANAAGDSAPELDPATTLRTTETCGSEGAATWTAPPSPALLVLEASKSYAPSQWQHDERTLDEPIGFAIPASLPVAVGNAGNHAASLRFRLGDGDLVTCTYRGGSSQSHPSGSTQIELGLRYVFQSCNDGSTAGDLATADYLRLSIGNGDSRSPSQNNAITTARVELREQSKWVLPGAVRVAEGHDDELTATLRFGAGASHPAGVDCHYEVGSDPEFLELTGCDGEDLVAGATLTAPWASLEVDAQCCEGNDPGAVLEARVLPPAQLTDDELLRLRLTPATVTLTEPGQARRIAVRGFVDAQEVDVTTLGITLETFGDDVQVATLPDASVRVTATSMPGHASFGVRASAHPVAATSAALVATAPLRSHVVELRASDMAHPSVGIGPVDPVPGNLDAASPGGIGAFTFEELAPDEPSADVVRLNAVVRSAAAASLTPGSVFALTDGHGFQGIVLATQTRGAFTKVEYMPLSVPHVFEAMNVDDDGAVVAAGYTWDAMVAAEMDVAREGVVDIDTLPIDSEEASGILQGPVAPLPAVPMNPGPGSFAANPGDEARSIADAIARACPGSLSGNLLALNIQRGFKLLPLASQYVMRFSQSSPAQADPRVLLLTPLLPPGTPVALLLSFRLDELSARSAFRLEYFAAIDARLRFDISYGGTCDVNELLGGDFVRNLSQFRVPLPFGLMIFGQVDPQLSFNVEANGGPTAVFRYSFSEQRDFDMGFQMGAEVPGGFRPHPSISDLNGDGTITYAEALSAPKENSGAPILSADWGLGVGGTEPVYSIQAEVAADFPIKAALTFGPGVLIANAIDRLSEANPALSVADRLRIIRHLNRASAALSALFEGGIVSVQSGIKLALRFGKHSSGDLLNASFDNTTYLCNELNRLGLQIDVTALEVSAFAGLSEALRALTVVPIFDINLTLVTVQMPPFSPVSFYTCQNPAFGPSTTGHVQRDSRNCGEPLAAGETATLHLEAYSQNDELDLFSLFSSPHFEAGAYLDGVSGPVTGGWRRIGAVPLTATSEDVHTYEGSFALDSEAAEHLSGEGELRMLSRGTMIGVIPMHDQLASITPACGCLTDADCDGDTCDIEAGETVGECSDESDVFTVFQANGLTFQAPGTNQAVVGTDCEEPLARNVTLRGVADTAVLNDGQGRTINEADLVLDGEVIFSNASVFATKVNLVAPPRDLTEGSHTLTVVLRGVGPDNAPWEDSIAGTFPVVVDVEDCDCPADPCEAFNAECGTLETPCGTFDCGRGCECIGNTCAGECPPETPRWNEQSSECEACTASAPTWDPQTQTCQAQCNGTVSESGNDGGPFFFSVDLGATSGSFSISGQNGGSVDDIVSVSYEGSDLYSSGCTASSWASSDLNYSGDSSVVTVRVDTNCANESGTYWEFTVNCQ